MGLLTQSVVAGTESLDELALHLARQDFPDKVGGLVAENKVKAQQSWGLGSAELGSTISLFYINLIK